MNTLACVATLGWYALTDSHLGPIVVALLIVLAMAGVTAVRFVRFLIRTLMRPV